MLFFQTSRKGNLPRLSSIRPGSLERNGWKREIQSWSVLEVFPNASPCEVFPCLDFIPEDTSRRGVGPLRLWLSEVSKTTAKFCNKKAGKWEEAQGHSNSHSAELPELERSKEFPSKARYSQLQPFNSYLKSPNI